VLSQLPEFPRISFVGNTVNKEAGVLSGTPNPFVVCERSFSARSHSCATLTPRLVRMLVGSSLRAGTPLLLSLRPSFYARLHLSFRDIPVVGNLANGNEHYRLWSDTGKANKARSTQMSRRPSISDFLTNLEQPMPLGEKLTKLTRNLWRRVVLRQNCCGNHGEPGC
jgi:hypothetical protein